MLLIKKSASSLSSIEKETSCSSGAESLGFYTRLRLAEGQITFCKKFLVRFHSGVFLARDLIRRISAARAGESRLASLEARESEVAAAAVQRWLLTPRG